MTGQDWAGVIALIVALIAIPALAASLAWVMRGADSDV